jgi:hypothetical protein
VEKADEGARANCPGNVGPREQRGGCVHPETTSRRIALLKTCFLILGLVSAVMLGGQALAAQHPAKPNPAAKTSFPKVLYGCSHCRIARAKPGNCPVCGQPLAKVKAYICPKCLSQSDHAGQCAHDKTTLEPTPQFLAGNAQVCPKCHSVVSKNNPCPVCAKTAGHP